MNLWSFLARAAADHPERTAVVDGPVRLTYADLVRRAAALAAWFQRRGVAPGDRISILDVNRFRYLEMYFAAAGAGAILNPLNWRLTPAELAYTIRDAGSRWLVAAPELAADVQRLALHGPNLEGLLWAGEHPVMDLEGWPGFAYERAVAESAGPFAPAVVADDAIAHLYYTSGTTGLPKGVMLTHGNVRVHAENAVAELELSARDVWGHFAPLFHLADAWAAFAITAVGGTHVMLPRFEAAAALAAVARERITITNLVPTMLNLMVKHPQAGAYDVSSLRVLLSGGAPIAPELVRRILSVFGCDYVQTYGMTETSPYLTLSLLPPHLRRRPPEEQLRYKAKTGRPFRGVELKVVRDDGTPVAADGQEVGEIRVRGATVTPGYWKLPEETARAFADGWLKTGDLAVLDAEGFVDIVDRKKDVIITGGEKVYSIEVENVLFEHPAVLEAAAFGRSDETWGESVAAAVVLRPGAAAATEDLLRWCRERLAGYKVPRSVEFLAELPKTGSGKISKKALRERR